MIAPNRLMPQVNQPVAKPQPSAPKPLHNELWSVRSLAQQHLQSIRSGAGPLVLSSGEAKLLLETLIKLIGGQNTKLGEMQSAAETSVTKAMQGLTDKITKAPEE